jgi:hypothetical protein
MIPEIPQIIPRFGNSKNLLRIPNSSSRFGDFCIPELLQSIPGTRVPREVYPTITAFWNSHDIFLYSMMENLLVHSSGSWDII